MIGVIAKSGETAAIEEFFELFKTPWEFFQEGQSYDVVLTTNGEIPEVQAKLLLIYGAKATSSDKHAGLRARSQLGAVTLDFNGTKLPIYGAVQTFEQSSTATATAFAQSKPAAFKLFSSDVTAYRFGYDLFQEVVYLLAIGQPAENAHIPTLELHITILRNCVLAEGLPLLEIPPTPAGYEFIACLTHDIDFAGIRRHKFDHTMWGFLYRSTLGGLWDFCRGRISSGRLARMWGAAVSLPLVYLGWKKDFWMLFEWYLKVEKDVPATYFFIPFKNRAGEKVSVSHAQRRATAYDITDLPETTARLIEAGCEIGVHGIDAWHNAERGREELARVSRKTQQAEMGIRMHWLLHNENTYRVLEEAGYSYDSTAGYNETVGYRCGTTQAFRPLGTRNLLELPLHIQDGALFFPQKLDLSEAEARERISDILGKTKRFGGSVIILWHDRSPGPERFWGEFYASLVRELRANKVWFASAAQTANWFRSRRDVVFERMGKDMRVRRCSRDKTPLPPLNLRIHRPCCCPDASVEPRGGTPQTADFAWGGEAEVDLDVLLERASQSGAAPVESTAR